MTCASFVFLSLTKKAHHEAPFLLPCFYVSIRSSIGDVFSYSLSVFVVSEFKPVYIKLYLFYIYYETSYTTYINHAHWYRCLCSDGRMVFVWEETGVPRGNPPV